MDTWHKYINKTFKYNLKNINIPQHICYGNFLAYKIAYQSIIKKPKQRLFNKFFENAAIVLQATLQQTSEHNEFNEIKTYIDNLKIKFQDTHNSSTDLGLLLGNITECSDLKYTFVEIIAFIRCMASQI